jgi:hypothetical protein
MGLTPTGRRLARLTLRGARPLSRVLPRATPPTRPIFLLGCPRSGTSVLFTAMRKSPAIGALPGEGHVLWEEFSHPRFRDWESNALGPADVCERERDYLYRLIQLIARGRRYMDKTPKNCLRIPYLTALFPDASFVFLRRRGADNVNSLIEGWRAHPRFATYRLPEPLEGLGELDGRDWSFVLVPGWRELRQARLEEICAAQYIACNEAALAARAQVDPDRWIDIVYEDFIAAPRAELGRVFERLGLELSPEVASFGDSLDRTPINVVTPPARDKWRSQNRVEIERILPLIADIEARLGYGIETPSESPLRAPMRNGSVADPPASPGREGAGHPDLAWAASIFGNGSVRFEPTGKRKRPAAQGDTETFAIFPHASRPHLLVPVASRRAAAAALAGYSNVHDANSSIRLAKALLALGLRVGAGGVLLSDRVSLARVDDNPDAAPPHLNLKPHLEEVLGRRDLEIAVRIGTMRPNRKPLLQILTKSGECLGYAKIGWNELTRALVRNEARMLTSFMERASPPATFAVPRLLHSGQWHDLELVIVSPLEAGHWWSSVVARDLPVAATRELGELNGLERMPLAESAYWRGSRERSASIEGPGADALREALERLEERYGETELVFGSWHGDWAPWNARRLGNLLVIWDWERSGKCVPRGLDGVHWLFHVELKVRGHSPRRAAEKVLRHETAVADALELAPEHVRLLVLLDQLEMALRFAEALTAGIDLEDRVHMPLLADLVAADTSRSPLRTS